MLNSVLVSQTLDGSLFMFNIYVQFHVMITQLLCSRFQDLFSAQHEHFCRAPIQSYKVELRSKTRER